MKFAKHIHLCMAWVCFIGSRTNMSSVRINYQVKRYSVWIGKKTVFFSGHYLSNDSNIDTDMFRHINVN